MSWRVFLASAILVTGLSGNANAHAIGIGDIVDGTSASIWLATWHTSGVGLQGGALITGPGGFSTTDNFTQLVNAPTPAAGWTGFDFQAVTDPAVWWQGLNLVGLDPGTYNYVLSGTFSGAWAPDGGAAVSDYAGSFIVTPIPAALPLFLSGLAAFALVARRRRSRGSLAPA